STSSAGRAPRQPRQRRFGCRRAKHAADAEIGLARDSAADRGVRGYPETTRLETDAMFRGAQKRTRDRRGGFTSPPNEIHNPSAAFCASGIAAWTSRDKTIERERLDG